MSLWDLCVTLVLIEGTEAIEGNKTIQTMQLVGNDFLSYAKTFWLIFAYNIHQCNFSLVQSLYM